MVVSKGRINILPSPPTDITDRHTLIGWVCLSVVCNWRQTDEIRVCFCLSVSLANLIHSLTIREYRIHLFLDALSNPSCLIVPQFFDLIGDGLICPLHRRWEVRLVTVPVNLVGIVVLVLVAIQRLLSPVYCHTHRCGHLGGNLPL